MFEFFSLLLLLLSQFNFGLHQFYSYFIFCRFHYRKLSFRVNVQIHNFVVVAARLFLYIAVADGVRYACVCVCILFGEVS